MKYSLYVFFSIILTTNALAQDWQWVAQAEGTGYENIYSLCTDSSGNIYLTGDFYDQMFLGNDTLDAFGSEPTFFCKMDQNGNVQWGKKIGGYDNTFGISQGAWAYPDIYSDTVLVISRMSGPNQNIGDCSLLLNGQGDHYEYHLTKVSSDGDCGWSQYHSNVNFRGLASDGAENLYCRLTVGQFSGNFHGVLLNTGTYLAKLSSLDGSLVWIKKMLDSPLYAVDILYGDGNLWLTGYTGGLSNFTLDTFTFPAISDEIFLAKIDTSASLQWVNTFAAPTLNARGWAGVDNHGNSYVGGLYQDDYLFGDTSLTPDNTEELYLIKYNTQGERVWILSSISTGNLEFNNLVTDVDGNTVITGKFDGSITFGQHTLLAAGEDDGFVAKFDSSGNCIGAKSIENTFGLLLAAIDRQGSVIVGGSFEGTTNFDGIVLNSVGQSDVFVAKIDLKTAIPEYRLGEEDNQLFIYANPNKGQCTIDVPEDFRYEDNLILRIFDTNGKLLRQTPLNMNQQQLQLDLQQEAKGVYTATLSNGNKTYNGRIVFE